jgi:hypothetical protein
MSKKSHSGRGAARLRPARYHRHTRRLSELQGDNPMVLMLGRGEHCPRERQHQREMLKSWEWCAVAFTQLVTGLPNDLHETDKPRISTGAYWPFLADAEYEVQRTLDIREYTDPHHMATVPHTLVLAPGLVIDKVYVGYWFWGRPSAYQLWQTCRTCRGASSLTSIQRRMMPARSGKRVGCRSAQARKHRACNGSGASRDYALERTPHRSQQC